MFQRLILLALCGSAVFAAAPSEILSLAEVHQHLQPGDFLILDIDNTLMIPKQQLGSDQWFYHQLQEYSRKGIPVKAGLEQALKDWHAVQAITEVLPCESCTSSWVRDLQNQGMSIIGLTTRGLGMSQITLDQLQTLDIDLSLTAPAKQERLYLNPWGVLFRKGIVFTAGTHKGRALGHFLDDLHLCPKRIVFLNDKASHIMELQSTVEERGIPFLGLRYGAVDGWVNSFNPLVTDVQWHHFGRIISDEEALEILQTPSNNQRAI